MLRKSILFISLLVTMIILQGCKSDDPVTTDFIVSGLDQANEDDDDLLEYFSMLYKLIDTIASHDKYPTNVMSDWNTKREQYLVYGVSKEDYSAPTESELQKASNASRITSLLNSVYFVSYDFKEGEPFTYLDYTITTYANDDYIYYHQVDTNGYIKQFSIEITDDNAKYEYYETSNAQTLYQRNDFDQGNLYINIFEMEDSIRYGYSFYNYQTDIEETIYYGGSTYPTLEYYLSNYQSGEIITYIIGQDSDIIGATLLDQGIKDLFLETTITSDETTYEIGFSAKNVSGWDLFKENHLYLHDTRVHDNYMVNNSFLYTDIIVSTYILNFREELYNNKADIYTGPYTYIDLENLYSEAVELSQAYDIQTSDDTITITLNGNTYTTQELKNLFLSYVPTEE